MFKLIWILDKTSLSLYSQTNKPRTTMNIKQSAPAIFTNSAHSQMSNRYTFVNTNEVLSAFENEGWEVSSATQRGSGIYNSHQVRLRNGNLPKVVGDTLLEAIITNSHNGSTRFSVRAGLHRLACKNGLTVPTSVSQAFSIRHQNIDMGEVRRITDEFAVSLPVIEKSVEKMKIKMLSEQEMVNFAKNALNLRWEEGSVPSNINIMDILNPRRIEDQQNDMWTTFNRVQESFIRGGVGYVSANGRRTKMKPLSNFMAVNQVNTKLWELAESMC